MARRGKAEEPAPVLSEQDKALADFERALDAADAATGADRAKITQAAQLALEGNMEQACALAYDAYARWNKYRDITAAFADHTPMDDTERLFQEMLVYAKTEEIPHFAACCTELSAMLKATYETHGFSLKNIL